MHRIYLPRNFFKSLRYNATLRDYIQQEIIKVNDILEFLNFFFGKFSITFFTF